MKHSLYYLLLIPALTFSGCVNTPQPSARPVCGSKAISLSTTQGGRERILTKEHIFIRNGGGTILGGARITLLAGVYVLYATDGEGVYWVHRDRGILRSGNIGMSEFGGVFIPADPNKPCEVWMAPKGNDAMIGLFGIAGMAFPVQDRSKVAIYLGDIPDEQGKAVRADFVTRRSDGTELFGGSVAFLQPEMLPGEYVRTLGKERITLTLFPNGKYEACLDLAVRPKDGSSSGTWRKESGRIILSPTNEDGSLKGHLGVLLIEECNDRPALLMEQNLQYEGNTNFYLRQTEEPSPQNR